MQTLKELIEKLSPELQEEVRDFVEFLLEKRARSRSHISHLTVSLAVFLPATPCSTSSARRYIYLRSEGE